MKEPKPNSLSRFKFYFEDLIERRKKVPWHNNPMGSKIEPRMLIVGSITLGVLLLIGVILKIVF